MSARVRSASTPKPALDALLGEAALAPVIRRARWLDTLDRHLRMHLPAPLGQHARLGNITGETLVYLVDSPVWHARLRLSCEHVLSAARGIGLEVNTLRIRTARQPFDLHTRTMAAIDARMRRENGTTASEAQALANMCTLFGELQAGEPGCIVPTSK